MSQEPLCPQCQSEHAYPSGELMVCPMCGHEWNPELTPVAAGSSEDETAGGTVVKDANGTILQDGDSVVLVKSLPVKGAPKPIKAGTKVKNIRLTEGDHNIDCKIEGYGAMALKSEFVKKA